MESKKYALLLFILLALELLLSNTLSNELFNKTLLGCFILINIYFSIFFIRKKYNTYLNIHTLFLSLFFVFICSRPVLDLLGYKNVLEFDFFLKRMITYETYDIALTNINIAIISYAVGVLIFKKNVVPNVEYLYDNVSPKVINIILFIGFVAKTMIAYSTMIAIIQAGYLSLFTGDLFIENKNIILILLSGFADVGIFFLVFGKERKWNIIFGCSILNMILSFCTLQRGPGMLFMSFIVFYYFYLKRNISIKIAFAGVCVLMFFAFISESISAFRVGSDNTVEYNNLLLDFLWGQGISLMVLVQSIDIKDSLNYNILDIFSNLYYNVEYLVRLIPGFSDFKIDYKVYSLFLSSITDERMFDLGYGMGGSYIGELYSIGKEYAQVLGGVLTGYLLSYFFYSMVTKSGFLKFYSFHAIVIMLFLPRDNFMDFLCQDWQTLVSFSIVSLIISQFYEKKNIYNNCHI